MIGCVSTRLRSSGVSGPGLASGSAKILSVETAVGFGVFSVGGDAPRVGFRVGHGILDLAANGLGDVFESSSLNPFLALGRSVWEDTVGRIGELVEAEA